jgi:hypothetical protein
MLEQQMLKAPIPGQSLTTEPKGAPWEKPPKIVDPEEALNAHLDKLDDPKVSDSMIKLMELGFPVKAMTNAILSNAVMNGVHSIDTSLIIAPVIHEYIKTLGEEAGVSVKTGMEEEADDTEREHITAVLNQRLSAESAKPVAEETNELPVEEMAEPTAPTEALPPQGLMQRRVN